MVELLVIVCGYLALMGAFCFLWGLFAEVAEKSKQEDESGEGGIRRG